MLITIDKGNIFERQIKSFSISNFGETSFKLRSN